MKRILLSTLALTMLIVSTAQAMDKPETPSFFQKVKNITMNTFSTITDNAVNFMYRRPFVTACLVGSLVPTKIAPFRRLALAQPSKHRVDNLIALGYVLAGTIVRANLLNIFSHQYLKEKGIPHKDSKSVFLLDKSECNPKIEKAK